MTVSLAIPLLLALAMGLVIVLDVTRYIIPNWLNLAIVGLYAVAAYHFHMTVGYAVLAASVALVIGLGVFSLGLMGGGDVKLLTVLMLFTGWTMVSVQFLVMTAVVGGVLVIVVLLLRALAPIFLQPMATPRILKKKEPVPYGVAIAGAFLWILMQGGIPEMGKPF